MILKVVAAILPRCFPIKKVSNFRSHFVFWVSVWIFSWGIFSGYNSYAAFENMEIQAGVEAPWQALLGLKFDITDTLFFKGGAGLSPSFLNEGAISMTEMLGAFNEDESPVAKNALASGIAFDIQVGYKWKESIYFSTGYNFLSTSGESPSRSDINKLLNQSLTDFDFSPGVELNTQIHSLVFHGGYIYVISNHFVLNLEVGLIKPILAQTFMDFERASTTLPAIETQVEGELDDSFKAMFLPTFSAWLGYRF